MWTCWRKEWYDEFVWPDACSIIPCHMGETHFFSEQTERDEANELNCFGIIIIRTILITQPFPPPPRLPRSLDPLLLLLLLSRPPINGCP